MLEEKGGAIPENNDDEGVHNTESWRLSYICVCVCTIIERRLKRFSVLFNAPIHQASS
jgi:hypothetical protein